MHSHDSRIPSRGQGLSLPEPNQAAQEASLRLIEQIRAEIVAAGGLLPFDSYMQLVLYAPGLGYYSGGSRKFGPEGDFVTSPEISPVFGQCLARQCQQVFTQLEQPGILEFGAGSGALAVALLRELMRLDDLPERYLILELSAELRHRQ
ncbi:MAG: SAM-dependent methyltransferase, partial [Chromatiales bacterium]|nr:SAM-dependent methyltransferase [Chromatiales bacterium]